MTRFWMTFQDAVNLVLTALDKMQGGEIFVPKLKSFRIVDLAQVLCPECELEEVGIRAGEKLWELLVNKEESRNCYEFSNYYTIMPETISRDLSIAGNKVPPNFELSSLAKEKWLSRDEIRQRLEQLFSSEDFDGFSP